MGKEKGKKIFIGVGAFVDEWWFGDGGGIKMGLGGKIGFFEVRKKQLG